ncbi:hypothetical protein Rs2_38695 [Raphanus sativus]|nr:hypothetical protein Rs2_38695 [Raphanus sativus]
MDELRRVTQQYINVDDPIERAARQHRVSQEDDEVMETTAAGIIETARKNLSSEISPPGTKTTVFDRLELPQEASHILMGLRTSCADRRRKQKELALTATSMEPPLAREISHKHHRCLKPVMASPMHLQYSPNRDSELLQEVQEDVQEVQLALSDRM